MTTSTDSFFSGLAESLCERSARATVSQAGPYNPHLRAHLLRTLATPPGEPGSFLAPPIFESLFNWEPQDQEFQQLDFIDPGLVAAMNAPPDDLQDERFPASRKPYRHQVEAWKTLMLPGQGPAQSAIISTGTASGKTECFLVPILSDLYRQAERLHEGDTLSGVQALFLYPLNALINSQKERLEAWIGGAGGKIRFSLYNGATPLSAPQHVHSRGYSEVKSRDELQRDPPPVLVTNATMLEYMLVRKSDRAIIDASKGKLRWIVLDEAHTYVGSNAAEISLLLRRVMHAFGVQSDEVQFVATSATIGDESAAKQLRQYLADLAGIGLEQVSFITGQRMTPALSAAREGTTALNVAKLDALDPDGRYRSLSTNEAMVQLRETLGKSPLSLPVVAERLGVDQPSAVRLLDLASDARTTTGDCFLPLRAHYFHRVQEGMWACSNVKCPGRQVELATPEWGFGAVYLDRRERCDYCDSLVYELALCRSCGQEHLVAELRMGALSPIPVEGSFDSDVDDGGVSEDEDETAPSNRTMQLICGTHAVRYAQEPDAFEPRSGAYPGHDGGPELRLARTETGLRCSRCGVRAEANSGTMRPLRLGGDFYLATAVPNLLESLPAVEEHRGRKPAAGRQLITFTDSRQGSARFAARSQFEAERNFLRASVYHRLWEQTAHKTEHPEAAGLRAAITALRSASAGDEAIRQLETQLAQLTSHALSAAELTWPEMVRFLSSQSDVKDHIREQLRERYIAFDRSEQQLGEVLLLREFFRRPKKQNSLETLGLVRVGYRGIDRLNPPAEWVERGLTQPQWMELVEVLLTFQVRAAACVILDHSELRLMGVPAYPRYLTPAEIPSDAGKTIRWPSLKEGKDSQLAKALAVALKVKPGKSGEALVNSILQAAWKQIQPLLRQDRLGWQLDLKDRVILRTVKQAYVCPITRRVLTSTLLGVTPFVEDVKAQRELYECESVTFPRPPAVRLRGPFECSVAEMAETEEWLNTDPMITELRRLGVWFEFSDRIVRGPAYFGAAEHSAQQSTRRLRQLEARFKAKDLNILSCSTTMEMGVNIGTLSAVTMNNVPPGPANFLQRAGRAGRNGQARAITLTMCRARPHELAVYRNPLWPFESKIRAPRVALNSERIVRRHVNSLLFSAFIHRRAEQGHTLSSEWLFGGEHSKSAAYVEWVRGDATVDAELRQGVLRLLKGSPLSHLSSEELLMHSGKELLERQQQWQREESMLNAQLEALGDKLADGTLQAARRSVEIQLKRHREEFLLGNLANSSFLPSYGFPLNVVPLVTLTHEERQIRRHEKDAKTKSGESSERVYNDFPTRQLSVALREYAPGTGIVLDGLVYRSEGVTLNWQIPTTGDDVKGIADLRYHYRCRMCGAVKSTRSEAKHCQACGHEVQPKRYLRPTGFAVDLYSTPSTNLSLARGSTKIETRISANTDEWRKFPAPALGRFRFSHDGDIIFRNVGPARLGYALCLRCGRVAAELHRADSATRSPLQGHKPLRGAKEKGDHGECTGYTGTFAEQRNIELGASVTTDVLEFAFQDPATGKQLEDQSLAVTLSVALQLAAAELLEVEPREIGYDINDYQGDDGSRHRAILLFDTADGGAGYVSSLPNEFGELFRRARRLLLCTGDETSGGCDKSCHSCLLSYSTQNSEGLLDRRLALQFLTEKTLAGLCLPPGRAVFGEATRAEYDSLHALANRYGDGKGARRIRVHLTAEPERWDFSVWPGWDQLRQLCSATTSVEFVMPKAVLDNLEWDQRNLIAEYLKGSGIVLRVVDKPLLAGDLRVHMEFELASQNYRIAGKEALAPDDAWLAPPPNSVSSVGAGPLPSLGGAVIQLEAVRKAIPGTFVELKLGKALEGNVRGFGHRFFSALRSAEPRLKAVLARSQPLTAYRYEDKYLCSPLIVALLREILTEVGALQGDVSGMIVTTAANPRQHPSRAHDDFQGRAQQVQGIERAIGISPKIVENRNARHRRELQLEWEDGTKLTVRLDHGLGFVKLHRVEAMDFDGSGAQVMNRFLETNHRLSLKDQGIAYIALASAVS